MYLLIIAIAVVIAILVLFTRTMIDYTKPNIGSKTYHNMLNHGKAEVNHRIQAMRDDIEAVYKPRIKKERKRVNHLAARISKAQARNKDITKLDSKAASHEMKASQLSTLMERELKFFDKRVEAAKSDDKTASPSRRAEINKARRSFGSVHPGTGATVGGFGRAGHKPAHHMPKIMKESPGRTSKPSDKKSLRDIIIGDISKGHPRHGFKRN